MCEGSQFGVGGFQSGPNQTTAARAKSCSHGLLRSHLVGCGRASTTENPRVGGSIPSLAILRQHGTGLGVRPYPIAALYQITSSQDSAHQRATINLPADPQVRMVPALPGYGIHLRPLWQHGFILLSHGSPRDAQTHCQSAAMTRSSGQIAARLLPLCLVIACQGETTTPTAVPVPRRRDSRGGDGQRARQPQGRPGLADGVCGRPIPDHRSGEEQGGPAARPQRPLDGEQYQCRLRRRLAPAEHDVQGPQGGEHLGQGHGGDKSRFSKVVVRAVAGAKVVVTPAEATVTGGATVQFVATGLTKNGERRP